MSSTSGSHRKSGRAESSEYWDDDAYGYDDYDDRTGRKGSRSSQGSSQERRSSQGNAQERRRNSGSAAAGKRSRKRKRRRRKMQGHNIILVLAAVIILLAVILAIMAVTGTIGATDYTSSTIEFLSSGKIRVTSIESFDQDYYDKDELKETIRDAIAEYGSGVEQEYLDVSDGVAQLVMLYDSAEDYVGFNGTDLFVGTVVEAEAAGYDFQSIMSAVSQEDTSKILNEATLDQLLENEVIILFEQADVVTYDDMLYATSNLGVTDSTHASAIDTISDSTPAIIILVNDG